MFYNFYRKTYFEEIAMKKKSRQYLEEMKKSEGQKSNGASKQDLMKVD